jgi:hypothetical protein
LGAHTANDTLHWAVGGLVDVRVRAEHLPQLLVAAFGDQVLVDLAERGQEAVGVVGRQLVTAVGDIER